MVRYLKFTQELHLLLRYDGYEIARWHVDSAFTVQPDFKSHSGCLLFLQKIGWGIAPGSTKQKLNTRSSTEVEVVAADVSLSKILLVRLFLSKKKNKFKRKPTWPGQQKCNNTGGKWNSFGG